MRTSKRDKFSTLSSVGPFQRLSEYTPYTPATGHSHTQDTQGHSVDANEATLTLALKNVHVGRFLMSPRDIHTCKTLAHTNAGAWEG